MAYPNIINKIPFDTNLGGLKYIYWIPMDLVTEIPLTGIIELADVYDTDGFADTEFHEGWRTVDFIRETAKFTEEGAIGPNGPYMKIKVSFKLAKHYDSRVLNFDTMREGEFCLAVIDSNGLLRIVGEINLRGERKGATFHEENTTGDLNATRNEYSCYFYSEQARKARAGTYSALPLVYNL